MPQRPELPIVVVMGVSGSGKSTVGRELAATLDVPYAEGDEFHPAANVAKMAAGVPLDDADRAPWLDAVAAWLAEHVDRGGVITCSALKRAYRDRLRAAAPSAFFLHLSAPRAELAHRMTERSGHFMPASLLDSQLAALEPLGTDERGTVVDATRPAPELARAAAAALRGDAAR
ncbi:gluconokinase [Nocardia brasiliensis ATCC 700358]|uniref:Gluconokinase n=2 Tax=Nocardia brasiliensis TaxID=37326 RepID=K0ENY0_NOCB7|nr:gluconokinase [Nocardia brasiliensis ATCC 700358]